LSLTQVRFQLLRGLDRVLTILSPQDKLERGDPEEEETFWEEDELDLGDGESETEGENGNEQGLEKQLEDDMIFAAR